MKAKRSLGQNFFTNANLGKHIVEKVTETNPGTILEIGPGKGFFTQFFIEKDIHTVCIEKDDILSQRLQIFLPSVEIYNTDVMTVDFEKLLQGKKDVACFGSLPYNLSKKIVDLLIKTENIKNYFFIIQKEVAEKYVQKEKSSILSLRTELFADAKILLNISPSNFTPKPKVNSSLIYFEKNQNYKNLENFDRFIIYLYKAFKQPRKKLKNNLSKNYDIQQLDDKSVLDKRAEEMNLAQHLKIWRMLE